MRIKECLNKISKAQQDREHWEIAYRKQEAKKNLEQSKKMKMLSNLDSIEKVMIAEDMIKGRDPIMSD